MGSFLGIGFDPGIRRSSRYGQEEKSWGKYEKLTSAESGTGSSEPDFEPAHLGSRAGGTQHLQDSCGLRSRESGASVSIGLQIHDRRPRTDHGGSRSRRRSSLWIECLSIHQMPLYISTHRGKGTASAVPPKSRNSGLQPLRVCFVPAPGLPQPHSKLSSSTQRSVPQAEAASSDPSWRHG